MASFPSRKRLLLLLVAFAYSGHSNAADYYVSAAGSDSNPGTMASPWKTLAKLNSRVFAAGDRIYLRGGDTFGGTLLFDNESGSVASPIEVNSYGTGKATISSGSAAGIYVYNKAGFRIKNLNIAGSGGATSTSSGVVFFNDLNGGLKLNYIELSNLDIRGYRKSGIEIGAWPADGSKSGYTSISILDCASHDNLDAGVFLYAYAAPYAGGTVTYAHASCLIRGCRANNNTGIANKGTNSGSGILLSEVDGATIERCVAYNNGQNSNFAGGGPIGIWVWNANNVLIQHNESYNNRTSSVDGGGFDIDGGVTNSVIQYNYSHGNDGAGYLLWQYSGAYPFGNNIVRYNVSQNDGRKGALFNTGGIFAGGNVTNSQIYNNTVYLSSVGSSGACGVRLEAGAASVRFRNNIVVTSGGAALVAMPAGLSGISFQGNAYWSSGSPFAVKVGNTTYSSLDSWRTATGQERNGAQSTGFHVDPQLAGPGGGPTLNNAYLLPTLTAYELLPTSPLVNAGLNLTVAPWNLVVGPRDYWGNGLPQGIAYDIGAHERSPVNLLNSGFENGQADWVSLGGAANSVVGNAHTGARSMHVGIGPGGRSQNVTASSAGTYVLAGWGKVSAAGERGWIGVSFYNASQVKLSQIGLEFDATTYQGKTSSFNPPAGTAYMAVWAWKDAGIGAYFYADDLAMVRQ